MWGLVLMACIPRLYSDSGSLTKDWVSPTNRWPLREPEQGLLGEGFEVGSVVPDFRLRDQFGDQVSMWQFSGQVVLLDISTMWCGPCQQLAEDASETVKKYEDRGFVYLTVLTENVQGQDPSFEDLDRWVSAFELESPVVADPDPHWASPAVPNGTYPALLVIDRQMRVVERVSSPTERAVEEAIDRELVRASIP